MPKIDLYRKIDEKYCSKRNADIRVGIPSLYYKNELGEMVQLPIDEETEEEIELNEIEKGWLPEEYDLDYVQEFHIGNPSALFGSSAITDSANQIGIAAHINSREAMFQETIPLKATIKDTPEGQVFTFRHHFPKDVLRGVIKLEFFFYLASVEKKHPFQADEIGMRLSDNIFETKLVIDGTGSTFPITESSILGGPLWQLRKHWDDPVVDPFSPASVEVELNKSHPLFKQLSDSYGKKSGLGKALMNSIVAQAMAMIIYQTVLEMNNTEGDSWSFDIAEDGSILQIVGYWQDTFEVDIQDLSISNVFNSLQQGLEKLNRKG